VKYIQDRDASGEILRLLIQEMAMHPAAFTPLSYAVWYEHTTGINPQLSDVIVQMLDNNEKLDDDVIEKLYSKYISEFNLGVERVLREHVQQLLDRFADFTRETDIQAHQYSNSLQAYSDILKQNLDPPKLVDLISNVARDTNKMIGFMQRMHSESAACRKKVKKLSQELQAAREEALLDPLTGILNRRGFENSAKKILANHKELNQNLSLLMFDIDHFKQINDTYGHLFGDKAICAISEILKSKVRGQDLVARLGGEEFAVILAETDVSGASVVAEHIRRNIEGCKILRYGTQQKIGGITVSIGVAAYVSGYDLVDLLDNADKALFASKENGRNRATVYANH
jgi:diguanylate cyclase